ncbi:MAG: hypothetical protein ABGY41_16865 [Candidatus Poribacteria bacterium]
MDARPSRVGLCLFVFITSLVLLGCGGDAEEPLDEDITPSAPVDPWSGAWGIVTVNGLNPAATERQEFLEDGNEATFTATMAFKPNTMKYTIELLWTAQKVGGTPVLPNTTVTHDHTGTYERTDTTYTLTPDEIQGAMRLSSTAAGQDWIITNLDLFEIDAVRWLVQREERGTWALDGSILTLGGDAAPIWVLKKR